MNKVGLLFGLVCILAGATRLFANGEKLYGVHWWDFNGGWQVGAGAEGGWSTETIVTHSDPWWGAAYFAPLYEEIARNRGGSIITRIDYNWGQTVPSPTNPDRATWASSVLDAVATLGGHANVWVLGNEPNLTTEGNGWADNQITPQGYADVYHDIRAAIKAVRPDDEVLVAPPSPGGLVPGIRWISGNDWLAQTIDAIVAIPGAGIDGFAIHAYGNPFASAATAVQQFHSDYVAQLSIIDAKGLGDAPVYINEWNRRTETSGEVAANEQISADFLRGVYADVDAWNQTPGNHNIVSLSWFVGNREYGDWDRYALDYWKNAGNPVGHPGDLWTAFLEGAHYPAGLKGTRPGSPGDFDLDGDVDVDDFSIWQTNFGQANPDAGDADLDGDADGNDFLIWQTHYPASLNFNVQTTVPEPSSWGPLIASLAAIGLQTRRRSVVVQFAQHG